MQSFLKKNPYWALSLVLIVLVAFYWMVMASERYVSRSKIVLESTQVAAPELTFASMFGSGAGDTGQLLLLREHLLSMDMLRHVMQEVEFVEHYSQSHIDLFSRLRDSEAPAEKLHEYYQRRISVEIDEYSGVLVIEVHAYDPDFAHRVNRVLVEAGERHMNAMSQQLAEGQVGFLEAQVGRLSERLDETSAALLEFQNREGLVSPEQTIQSINQVVASLEGELASLQAQRQALTSFQSAQSSDMRRVQSQIDALRDQIREQRQRLAQAAGESLNRVSAEYQRLELQAQFAQDSYSSAIGALENTRIEAARQLKQVSLLQSATLPEYAEEPRRLYNAAMFAFIAIFITLILQMLMLIIRDHRD